MNFIWILSIPIASQIAMNTGIIQCMKIAPRIAGGIASRVTMICIVLKL